MSSFSAKHVKDVETAASLLPAKSVMTPSGTEIVKRWPFLRIAEGITNLVALSAGEIAQVVSEVKFIMPTTIFD